jgi:predicted translin family RNA/ssDNA-binding protein
MGICDLTGELTRMAVAKATKREFKTVEEIKEFVEAIYGEFLKFDLRNGNLRKKYDALKWNLKRLEEVMYDTTRR